MVLLCEYATVPEAATLFEAGATPAETKSIALYALPHFPQFILTPKGGHEHEKNLSKRKTRQHHYPPVIY